MNIDKLVPILPKNIFNELVDLMCKFEINTPLRLAHFLAQCSHESAGFKILEENLNYSAQGLLKIFKKYFNATTADQYARKPEMIASRAYANREGNGNEASKEGYKFRGRGAIQLTGKNNYLAFSKIVGEDLVKNPDLVKTKYALLSAGWYWDVNKLNKLADKGSSTEVVTSITKVVNGGTNGLDHRIEEFNKFYNLLK